MKVGLLSESPADEAALHILVEALLGRPVTVAQPPLRARGWPNVSQVLPAVMWHLQFSSDADALVVCVDADDSAVHEADHADPDVFHPQCRLCQLEMIARRTRKRWRLAERDRTIKLAFGLAVPAVETWYLFGRDPTVGEWAWREARERGATPYTRRELKVRVYGTPRPPLALETRRAREEARRVARDLPRFEAAFPVGFGHLARSARAWRSGKGS